MSSGKTTCGSAASARPPRRLGRACGAALAAACAGVLLSAAAFHLVTDAHTGSAQPWPCWLVAAAALAVAGLVAGRLLASRGASAKLLDANAKLRRLAMIAEQAGEGIATADLDGTIRFANAAWARMHGYAGGKELVGVHLRTFHTDRQMAADVVPFNDEVRRSGHCVAEVGHVRRDGMVFPTEMTVTVYRDERGEPIGLIGFATDITRRKAGEEELRRAKEAAEAATRAKSRFLANMSHEIRTPMTAILGYAELVADSLQCCQSCPDLAGCRVRTTNAEHLRCIRTNGRHLLELINDVLDFSRIEAGGLEMHPRPCRLVDVLADVASMMRVRARRKNVAFHVEYAGELPETILTDAGRVRQALVNLVGNAIKFTVRGEVRLTVRFLPQGQPAAPAVRIDVTDTGCGIAPDQLDRLFEPFVQADASTSRRHGGTGLGLAITANIARLLGGELTAASRPGQGSTFTLTIPTGPLDGVPMLRQPLEAARETPAARTELAGPDELAGLRVLLAEDAPDNQRLIAAVLRRSGADVTLACDGRQAVDAAAAEPFDVLLMDMQMPGMDGYEATRTLRRAGYAGPIVALTAHAGAGYRDKCLAAGCDGYLAKPVQLDELVRKVAAVAGKGSRRATRPTDAGEVAEVPAPLRSTHAHLPELAELIATFVSHLPQRLEAMRTALHAAQHAQLASLAHQLKGAAGSYGFPSLSDQAARLEAAARAQDAEGASLALAALSRLCAAASQPQPAGADRDGERG